MLAGFQLNLQAMSLVSLLVGMFLIYNTIEASVVRRRSEIGILRSLGVTRREIRWLFLGEAAVLGAIGIAVGMAGGYLARPLARRNSRGNNLVALRLAQCAAGRRFALDLEQRFAARLRLSRGCCLVAGARRGRNGSR